MIVFQGLLPTCNSK